MAGRRHVFTGSKYEELAGYARAVVVGDRIFVSGTVGYDFKTGALPETAEGQTDQALDTIAWSLKQAGSGLTDIVRVRVYVPNPDDVMEVSTTLKRHLGIPIPPTPQSARRSPCRNAKSRSRSKRSAAPPWHDGAAGKGDAGTGVGGPPCDHGPLADGGSGTR